MNHKEILEVLNKYEAKSSMPKFPLIWDNAFNWYIRSDNKDYIDFTSGIFVTNCGHESIASNISTYLDNGNPNYAYSYPTLIKAIFIKKLMEMMPNYLEKVCLTTTGAEAVEIACKLMRLAQVKRNQPQRTKIASFLGSMHGKTRFTEELSGKYPNNDIIILPFPNGFSDQTIQYLTMFKDEINGIVIETYRGWDAQQMPISYIQTLAEWAKNNNMFICIDEVQGGFWRTGELFHYYHYGITPDLVCVGKGLGGGVPISAVLGSQELIDSGTDLTSTFSGHAISCAGAYSNLLLLEKLNKTELKDKGWILKQRLQDIQKAYPQIKYINSYGLLGAVVFSTTDEATEVCRLALDKGLLVVYTGRESIKIGPPLTISTVDLLKGLSILEESLGNVSKI
jgi:4-aminobutyrate aminotransferase-like enzyme